jgi:hypothetical protein
MTTGETTVEDEELETRALDEPELEATLFEDGPMLLMDSEELLLLLEVG